MRLSVSNIGWGSAPDDPAVLELLRDRGVEGIDVAPTRLWPGWEGASLASAEAWRAKLEDAGFVVPAAQSLLYQRPELTLFGDEAGRRALVEQSQSRKEEELFRQIRERVSQGASLAEAFEEHPQWFSDLYVNMVHAGQATGNLDVVFKRLADYLQAQRALRRKVVSAMTYPMMMIAIGIIVVAFLMIKVVPKITEMLLEGGQILPTPTRILIGISDFVAAFWWMILLAVGALSYALQRVYYHSDGGRLFLDRALLAIPLVGDVLRKQSVSRFTNTLSTLLQSGVPVVQSLEITQRVVGNRVIADATGHIRTRIVEGTDIATPLKATGAFPSVVGYMVAVGEQSGELEQMLDRIAAAYDEEIEVTTERMTAVLEPIMIVILAVVVGFIVVSIILPILQMGQM